MSAQPEALRLAEKMESYNLCSGYAWHCHKAAAELRRLHEVNAELLAAAKDGLYVAESWVYDQWEGTSNFDVGMQELTPIRAAIAKAEGEMK